MREGSNSAKIPRLMFAATSSGSGKTLLSCAMLTAAKKRGIKIRAMKCGPDYIDPMFHREAAQVESGNLDTFFTRGGTTRALLAKAGDGAGLLLIEGVMGLFDGREGLGGTGSSYDLAAVTDTPVILIVDCKGMGQSVIALIKGYLACDQRQLIRGVILNRMSASFYAKHEALFAKELSVPVLGVLPKDNHLILYSRSLGLTPPSEADEVSGILQHAAEVFAAHVQIDRLLDIAKAAPPVIFENTVDPKEGTDAAEVTIAVARDEAFGFYYEENLTLLRSLGAKLTTFSPLHDKALPSGADALYLGGGFPERYAKQLSENTAMRDAVRDSILNGMPYRAEGGGFLYLQETICDEGGSSYPMAGVFDGNAFNTGSLRRFGYKAQGALKGHEFHTYDVEDLKDATAEHGFIHWYYPSDPAFAKRFIAEIRDTRSDGI